MSATEDDTELRDLLIQNLENNGVLNKLKAEMRAAVFLAMDEQDKVENKAPLVNENLRKCLNTSDGRLVASLIIDFLQVFHLDFTLAVFQPEINSLNGLDSREQVSRDLDVTETDMNSNTPLLLELVKSSIHRENTFFSEGKKAKEIPKELSPRQIADARRKFDIYDMDRTGGICKDYLKDVFVDLFPNFNKNMLDKFVTDELRDKASSKSVDFQEFLGLYKCFFSQCRSVVSHDCIDVILNPNCYIEEKTSPVCKGIEVHHSNSESSLNFSLLKDQGTGHVTLRHSDTSRGNVILKKGLDPDPEAEEDVDADEGDSFFDDPLPKPQKTYGCAIPRGKSNSGLSLSEKRNRQIDLSALSCDTEGDGDLLCSEYDKLSFSELRRAPDMGEEAASSPLTSLSDPAPPRSVAVEGSHSGDAQHRAISGSRKGVSSKTQGLEDFKTMNDKTRTSVQDDYMDYDDDFNSHRSDISKSELSIGEEIEEVSIEGPDVSDKVDERTQDLSVSQLSHSYGADYMEEVP